MIFLPRIGSACRQTILTATNAKSGGVIVTFVALLSMLLQRMRSGGGRLDGLAVASSRSLPAGEAVRLEAPGAFLARGFVWTGITV